MGYDCAGAYVQRIGAARVLPESVGKELLQGGEVGQESVQVRRLQHQDLIAAPPEIAESYWIVQAALCCVSEQGQ